MGKGKRVRMEKKTLAQYEAIMRNVYNEGRKEGVFATVGFMKGRMDSLELVQGVGKLTKERIIAHIMDGIEVNEHDTCTHESASGVR